MITLLAATGFTGQLVAAELKRRQLNFRLAARSPEKLAQLADELGGGIETIVADVTDPATLGPVFDGTKILLNCAGPFVDLGEPVVSEAARRGVHYLDTTGEQPFIKLVFDKYGELAKRNNAVLVPAAAYDYAFGDAGAALISRGLEPCDEISIVYSLTGFHTSRGTKKSMLRAVAQPGYLFIDESLVDAKAGEVRRDVALPDGRRLAGVSFPGGEVLQVPLHVNTRSVITLLAVSPTMAGIIGAASTLSGVVRKSTTDAMIDRLHRNSLGPDESQRQATSFVIRCEARRGAESRVLFIRGHDPYGITAVSVVALAERLLQTEPQQLGAIAPSMLFGPEFIRSYTEAAGFEWSFQ